MCKGRGTALMAVTALLSGGPAAAQWVANGMPPNAGWIYSVDCDRTGVLACCGGPSDGAGIWRRAEATGEWTRLLEIPDPGHTRVTGALEEILLAGSRSPGDLFYVSTDGGLSWDGRGSGVDPQDHLVAVGAHEADPSVIYAGAPDRRRIYRSTDLGETWSGWGSGGANSGPYRLEPVSGGPCTAFALLNGIYVYVWETSNCGEVWSIDPDAPTHGEWDGAGSLASLPADPGGIAWLNAGGWLRLRLNGSWIERPLPSGVLWFACEIPVWAPERVYIAGATPPWDDMPRVARSDDLGQTWTDLSAGLPLEPNVWYQVDLALAQDRPIVYLGLKDLGVWSLEQDLPVAVPGAGPATAPGHLTVIPTPTTGEVSIRWGSTAKLPRVVEIFDASGRLIRVLQPGADPASASGVRWDGRSTTGEEAPAGLYLVRATSSGGVRTGTVVRIK